MLFLLAEGTGASFDKLKKSLKKDAASSLTMPTNWHDAGFDAAASLVVFEKAVQMVRTQGGWGSEEKQDAETKVA